MKKAEEYLQDIFNPDKSLSCDREELQLSITLNPQLEYFEKAIKQAQIEAIEETCRVCAENAKTKSIYPNYVMNNCGELDFIEVNQQSILDCAGILKNQL